MPKMLRRIGVKLVQTFEGGVEESLDLSQYVDMTTSTFYQYEDNMRRVATEVKAYGLWEEAPD